MTIVPDKFRMDFFATFRREFRGIRDLRGEGVFMVLFARLCENRGLLKRILNVPYLFMARRRGIEIASFDNIGGGLVLAHGYGITVNKNARIGHHVVLSKGCTIGGIGSGRRAGLPVIGNYVVVGINATVVGGVKIGNNVRIAPNAFVNFDVPDNSLVIGNPGVVHHKIGAVEDNSPERLFPRQ